MSITLEFIAAFVAMMVFVGVLFAFRSVSVRREREAPHRRWQADLRTRGA